MDGEDEIIGAGALTDDAGPLDEELELADELEDEIPELDVDRELLDEEAA